MKNRQLLSCIFVVFLLLFLFLGKPIFSHIHHGLSPIFSHIHRQLSSDGLVVEYYKGMEFNSKICTRSELKVYREYGLNQPAWRVPKDGFTSRWSGYLVVPKDDTYTFVLRARGGSRLYIDGKVIIDQWKIGNWNYAEHGNPRLKKGKHKIRIEYVHRKGEAGILLGWNGGHIPKDSGVVLSVPYIVKK